MPVPLSASAREILQRPGTRVERQFEIVRDLLNADLRTYVDITKYVVRWGTLTGDSTLRRQDWELPGASFTLDATDGYLIPSIAGSVWEQLGAEPGQCHLKLTLFLRIPDGNVEVLHTYYGEIHSAPEFESTDNSLLMSIKTHFAGAKALDTGISKSTGDESFYIGSSW